MDEWVDVLDASGKKTGERILKSDAHRKGVFHPTVHIWFYTENGEVLLQQRSFRKETFPLLWDVSVAGHLGAGEGISAGALRETKEEIGLEVLEQELIPVGMFKSVQKHDNGILDCEFHHTFICPLSLPLSSLDLQNEEVEATKLVPLTEWEIDLFSEAGKSAFVPHDEMYYREVIRAIKSRL